VGFLMVPSAVFAQAETRSRYLQIEDLSGDARTCGLEKGLIVPIAAKQLKEIGIQIVTVPTTRYVLLSAFAAPLERSAYCVIVWTLDIKALELTSGGKGPVDDVRSRHSLLCRGELIGLYNRNSGPANIAEAMRTLAAQCSRRPDI
jgi:hypothetical protein